MLVLMFRELSSQSELQKASVEPLVNRNIQNMTQAPISTNRTTSASRTPIPPTRTALQSTSTPTTQSPTKISTSCPKAPTTRISINNLVRVITTDNDRLVLRSIPEINDGTELQRLNKGTELKIFNGPVCVRDPKTSISYWFWEVRIKSTDAFGWVAEGDRSLYYLEVIR